MTKKVRSSSSLVDEEQDFLDKAIDNLNESIESLRGGPADVGVNKFDTMLLGDQNLREAAILERALDQAFFGSFLNFEEDCKTNYHIGLAYVELDDGVIINFEAPLGSKFYQGRVDDKDLGERRNIRLKTSEVISVELETPNEVLRDETKESSKKDEKEKKNKQNKLDSSFSSSIEISDIRARDFLLEDLKSERTGEINNIVSTIQSNQDRLIRSDFSKPYGIQGGPGTGKTIVGLHRVSNILYQLRGKQNLSALVIGPSDRFIKYIENFLPSLGKNAAKHMTVENLCLSGLDEKDQARVKVSLIDQPGIELVKSMLAMSPIIRKIVATHISPENLRISTKDQTIYVSKDEIATWAESIRAAIVAGEISLNDASSALSKWLAPLIEPTMNAQMNQARARARAKIELLEREAKNADDEIPLINVDLRDRKFSNEAGYELVAKRIISEPSPFAILAQLHEDKSLVEADSNSPVSFTNSELAIVRLIQSSNFKRTYHRSKDVQVSRSDISLIYEICLSIKNTMKNKDVINHRYSHVLVDESQDISQMGWLAITRNIDGGSVTVLADFVQRTSRTAVRSWQEIWKILGFEETSAELLAESYRVSNPILNYARGVISPELRTEVPIGLLNGKAPIEMRFRRGVTKRDLRKLIKMVGEGRVGIITDSSNFNDLATVQVEVLHPLEAKGLEFDHVIVVEPGAWVDETEESYQLLYVALTRPTKTLVVAYSEPLPKRLVKGKVKK